MESEKVMKVASNGASCVSILGSYQICHTVCMSLIALLAVLGITITGMPLLFLTKIALPFWLIAVTLFAVLLILRIKRMDCITNNSLTFNGGLLIIGIPFLQNYYFVALIIGSLLIVYSTFIFLTKKLRGGK
ncbi:hypothetical protein HZA97_02900 [Candidatus Woesearchaeota archaeon]|nr:hypothetical protein [Candidatus Woesearchaeota archaeon]